MTTPNNQPFHLFNITDGSAENTVNLLSPAAGVHLYDWVPQVTPYADVLSGQQGEGLVVARRLNTVGEKLEFDIDDLTQDSLMGRLGKLLRLLERGVGFWTSRWATDPVYLVLQPTFGANPQYASLRNYSLPELSAIFDQPFLAYNNAVFTELTLNIERDQWQDQPPQTGAAIRCFNSQPWNTTPGWATYTASAPLPALPLLPAGGEYYMMTSGTRLIAVWSMISPVVAGQGAYYSNDKGITWAAASGWTGFGQLVMGMAKVNDSLLFVADREEGMKKSVDGGITWTISSGSIANGPVAYSQFDGYIYAWSHRGFYKSGDSGANWETVVLNPTHLDDRGMLPRAMAISPITGTICTVLIGAVLSGVVYRSADFGLTWEPKHQMMFHPPRNHQTMLCDEFGVFYQIGANITLTAADLYKSYDDGLTWVLESSTPVTTAGYENKYGMYLDLQGRLWVYGEENIRVSYDRGKTWELSRTVTALPTNMADMVNGDMFIGDVVGAASYQHFRTVVGNYGTDSDNGMCLVTNKCTRNQITHMFLSDGGVFSANRWQSAVPFDLLPTPPSNNDAFYWISNDPNYLSNVFDNILINVEYPGIFGGGTHIFFEYWSGAAWSLLTYHDNTGTYTDTAFSEPGLWPVVFPLPANWASTTVNGVTGKAIRARMNDIGGATFGPTHGIGGGVTANVNYAEVEGDDIGGDIPALLRVVLVNMGDKDGPGGAGPDLYASMVMIGLRSNSRGEKFRTWINLSGLQNQPGVYVTLGTLTTLVTDSAYPTGSKAQYNPAALEAMATRVTVTLDSSISTHYVGLFRLFLRVNRTAGAVGDMALRVTISVGSGNVVHTTKTANVVSTSRFELIDLGQVSISRIALSGNDAVVISVQASSASGTPNMDFCDIGFLPMDEWGGLLVDMVNDTDSEVGRSTGVRKLLDLDSITDLKETVKAEVKTYHEEGYVTNRFQTRLNGEAMLQHHAGQRLHFIFARYPSAGVTTHLLSDPAQAYQIRTYKVSRYRGMRGAD